MRSAGGSSAPRREDVASSDANMNEMRQYLTTLLLVWTAACIAAYFYSQQQNIPAWIVLAVLPAFLAELAFFLAPGFSAVRERFEHVGQEPLRALTLAATAAAPYLMESLRTGTFGMMPFLLLVAAVTVTSFWYAAFRPSLAADLLFLAFMAAVYLSKLFDHVYAR